VTKPDLTFSSDVDGRHGDIVDLFVRTFTASEGADEGALIGKLAGELLETTTDDDVFVFSAIEDSNVIGAIIFSRLTYSNDTRSVFVLGPVAVATEQQGRGVGQALLNYGLDALRDAGVDVAMTYGDPAYYSKVGFAPISEETTAAPFKLNFPEGWLGQCLDGEPFKPLKGACRCVPAFDDPAFW
jgi:predicted N-acetyltransferase YhbS